jgi:hypothetical protein
MVSMSRSFTIVAILVVGIYTTAMSGRLSCQLATIVWSSYTCATFSVALDASKWLMLPFAAMARARLGSVTALDLARGDAFPV